MGHSIKCFHEDYVHDIAFVRLFNASVRSFNTLNCSTQVDLPCMKPNCCTQIRSLSSRHDIMLSLMINLNTLHIALVRLTGR